MMGTRRLVDYHIGRLKDKNRDVRLRSIEELRLLSDAEAMPALKEVFETDVDPDVRSAAKIAGYDIFKKTKPKT